jgi:polysaccharide export outer membrane protein
MKLKVWPLRLLLAVLFLALNANSAFGQQRTAYQTESGDPELKLSPARALQNLEPAANEEYELGPGDEISLDFPGRPELSGKKVVGPDGRITLSLVGPIKVADKTRAEVAKVVADALSAYYKDITLTVNVDRYGSNRIIVIGSVQHPGVLYFDTIPTLLDVIARGGLLAGPSGASSSASTARDGIPEHCAIYRGNDEVVWVDLRELLQSGSSMADLRLRRNDIVFVPAQQEIFVSVLGSVMRPGAITLTSESTLASVLAQAGGLAESASGKVQVIQPSTGKTSTVSFKSILKDSFEVRLHAGDVVYVPASGFYKATYVIQRLSPIASVGALAAVAQ